MIRREDGSWLYMLPSVVDDVDMAVTHVVRGEDHVTNTGLQLQMFEALGADAAGLRPRGPAGRLGRQAFQAARLARRRGDARGRDRAGRAWSPSWRGSAPACRSSRSRASSRWHETFDFATFGRAPARFDLEELAALNARILHQLPFEQVQGRLPAGMAEADWVAIRPNLKSVAEAADWWEILHGHVERARRPRTATSSPPPRGRRGDRLGATPWPQLVARLKESSGRAGKALFLPLRRALSPAATAARRWPPCCR